MSLETPTDSSSPPRPRRTKWLLAVFLLVGVAGLVTYFGILPRLGASNPEPVTPHPSVASGAKIAFHGSGATFPYPYYSKLFSQYNKLRPNVQITYTPTGSGTGIKQISDQSTDFGASDAPLSDEQLKAARGGHLLHIPMALGAVVPIYNVPGFDPKRRLILSGEVLAGIFRGTITRWNDPALAKLNPGAALPDSDITIVYRTDGSGTTYIFSEYLSKISPDFAKSPGRSSNVNWPAAKKLGGTGSDGVSALVSKTPGTLGYVELTYALQNKIAYGDVINAAGNPIHASLLSVTNAAVSLAKPPADLRMSITNAEGEDDYPISSFTYLLVYQDYTDAARADALADFLIWAATDGQKIAPTQQYAPLPADIAGFTQGVILSMTVNGKVMGSK
jgi:phosphate transport system substrate-binding protein